MTFVIDHNCSADLAIQALIARTLRTGDPQTPIVAEDATPFRVFPQATTTDGLPARELRARARPLLPVFWRRGKG